MVDETGKVQLGSQLELTAESFRKAWAADAAAQDGPLAGYAKSLDFIAERAAELAAHALDEVDLFTLLLDGWATAKKVREAGRSTREAPGSVVQVNLASATAKVPQKLVFKVKVGGAVVGTVELTCELQVEFELCHLTVKGGAVIAVDLGSGVPSIALKYRDRYIVKPRTLGAVTFGRTALPSPIPIP